MDVIASILKEINGNYANLMLVVLAIGTVAYSLREYKINRRPIVYVNLKMTESNGSFLFFAHLKILVHIHVLHRLQHLFSE
jgi:hypothetical protein